MSHDEITSLLQHEITAVTGCTGPTAYALASACCRPHMTSPARRIDVQVSPAYLKMGFGVASPGTSRTGIEIATAIGLIAGDPNAGMQVLKNITNEDILKAEALADSGMIHVGSTPEEHGVYVRNEIKTDNETICSVVAQTHDGIREVTVNGVEKYRTDPEQQEERLEDHPDRLTMEDIFSYADTALWEEVGFLLDDYQLCLKLSEDGICGGYGLQTGKALLLHSLDDALDCQEALVHPLQYLPDDLPQRANILVCAASDGRMGGSKLPAIAVMGDGNQGLTLLLPLGAAGEVLHAPALKTARAMALGALMLFYVKMHIGRAAAMCLCAIAASAGVAAGYAYLRDFSESQIRIAVKNAISPLAGMLCDGAKNACALKMSMAVKSALQSVELAGYGVEAGYYDGICDTSLEHTVEAITKIANETMELVDQCMVNVILDKERRKKQR